MRVSARPALRPHYLSPEPPAGQGASAASYLTSHWRSLDYFNLYRLLLALTLALAGAMLDEESGLFAGFGVIAAAYLVSAVLFEAGIRFRKPAFPVQITAHILADIVFVLLLMVYAESRLANTLALLLVISIASGGLVGKGRMALFYAALASIAVLLHHGIGILVGKYGTDGLFQVGLLCMGYFATGLLGHGLAQRAIRSERAAALHANELALLGRIHAQAVAYSQNGLLAVRGDGSLRYASAQAARLLGHGVPEPGTALLGWAPELASVLTAGDTLALTLDATPGKLRVRCLPVSDDDTQILVIEDLSATEQAAQQLKLAALGRLTANLAHEIRNPLSAIGHAAQLLHEDVEPLHQRLTEIITNNVRRLDRLVHEVLAVNRRDRVHPVRIDSAGLAVMLREIAESENIPATAMKFELASALHFRFDPDHLRRILWNLTRNAWSVASRRPGCLVYRLREHAGQPVIDVIDDGPGIPAEREVQLFEPFFTTDAQGVGLGLFLARELAESNQASLRYLASEQGAHFCLSLRKEN